MKSTNEYIMKCELIKKLLKAARDTQITDEQIAKLRSTLEEGKQSNLYVSNEFLSRTYNI
jgi:hypothetical protein